MIQFGCLLVWLSGPFAAWTWFVRRQRVMEEPVRNVELELHGFERLYVELNNNGTVCFPNASKIGSNTADIKPGLAGADGAAVDIEEAAIL